MKKIDYLFLLLFCVFGTTKQVWSQCNLTNTGTAATPTCSNQNLSLGAGESRNMAFVAGERYVFSFSDNSQSSGICINGARITSQNYVYTAPSTGNIAVGMYRNNGTWTWSSAVLTYRKETPAINSTVPNELCGGGQVTLNAVPNFGTPNWYDVATGGSILGTANSFTTPNINATTTYYVEATANGCTSSRTAVTATIKSIPTITSSTPASRCGAGTVTLTAAASAGTINWYSAATGGTSLATGTSFTTPSIATTTTYYVDATSNGCTTAARTPVTATVITIPTITSTTPASRCGIGTVTLGATTSKGSINWYDVASGGTSLGTGTSYTSPSISGTTTYYVDATDSGCTSSRTPIIATINTTPGSWSKIYETTNPSRDGSGSIVYVPGYGKTGGAASSFAGGFSKVKYRMENNVGGVLRWAEVSFDAWSGLTTTGLQIPDHINNATIQRNVFNIEVSSNMPGVNVGKFDTGRVEMWPYNYGVGLSGLIPAGNASTYDWDDEISVVTNGHGSFQIHNVTSGSRQTILAWNMHRNGGPAEIGFGDAPTGNPDWTGTTTNGSTNFKVQIFVGSPVFNLVSGSQNQTLCSGTSLVNTVYSYGNGATGLSVANLPAGLTSSLDTTNKRLTISGAPTTGGTYSVFPNGNFLCAPDTLRGVITLNQTPTITSSTPASRCGTGTVALTAAASAGTINWYSIATGGTSLATGTSFTTPSIATTTTYYVDATANGCTTATRTAVAATVNALPTATATAAGSTTLCTGGSVVINANTGTGLTYQWLNNNAPIASATNAAYTANAAGSYRVLVTNANSCKDTSTAVAVVVNTIPTITSSTPASRCGTGTVALTAAASAGTINWYANSTGGTSLATGTSFTTPSISATTTYYVDATANGCTTATRTAVVATVNPNLTASVSISSNTTSICGSAPITFTATPTNGGTTPSYQWKKNGVNVGTNSDTYVLNNALNADSVYVVMTSNATPCLVNTTANSNGIKLTSSTVTPTVAVTANPGNIICNGTSVTFTANATNGGSTPAYQWKRNGVNVGTNASTFVTSLLSTNDSISVVLTSNASCLSTSTATSLPVVMTVNAIPTITSSTPASRCGTGTVALTAAASAGTINWYSAATGGTSLATGTSFTTPSISATTTYYVDATANGCTTATRTAVAATVNAIPTITSSTPASRCGTGTVSLTAAASAGTINWYNAATGGTSLATGTSFTTPSISATTTYYVDATANGCTTATRTAVAATVNAIPTATATAAGSTTLCTGGSVVINANTGTGLTYQWLNNNAPIASATNAAYTANAAGSYRVLVSNGSCSDTSTAVTVVVNAIPTITSNTPASRCGTGTVALTAAASAGTINWYSVATGGTSLATGTSFTTPSISATTTYYVDATANGCTTATRTAVAATVNAIPTITSSTPASRCGTGTVSLTAAASAGTINWYSAATGGTSLANGTSFTTPSISATTTYYVDATANGCTTASRTSIAATVNAKPLTSAISGRTTVHSDTVETYAVTNTTGSSYVWTVIGGAKLTGGTTNSITVDWDVAYTAGMVKVVETNTLGCQGDTVFKPIVSIVPVEFLSFDAKRINDKVNLTWVTASEINNSHFEVERSIDNNKFENIGTVKGNGTTSMMNTYKLTDNISKLMNSNATTLYYRLKQVDFDGEFAYTDVRTVELNKLDAASAALSPNPFTDHFNVTINEPKATSAMIQVMDANGKQVRTLSIELNAGTTQYELGQLGDLSSGMYFVQIITASGNSYTIKAIKK